MTQLWPFRAVRPVSSHARDVASHAYDVLSRGEARLVVCENPHSFLRVEKSEINLPDHVDSKDPRVYRSAKKVFDTMMKTGIMIQDREPFFYIYRQKMAEHIQRGIVACVDVEDYLSGHIKRHEMTRSDKETDRTVHVNMVNAHTGPVFLTYRDCYDIDAIIEGIIVDAEPDYEFQADDDTVHAAWTVGDRETIDRIKNAFESVDSFYIADGHHRAAAAARVAALRRQENPDHKGTEEYCRMMAVLFSHRQLRILPYNRVVRDLAGMNEKEYLVAVENHFHVEPSRQAVSPESRGVFGMYMKCRWWRMTIKDRPDEGCDLVKALDVSILQDRLITPIFGIHDVRSDERIDFVGGIRGTEELERLVDSGRYAVAFSLHPTDMESLMAVSDQGQIMPPKSTWFEPKLKSGLFVHLLE